MTTTPAAPAAKRKAAGGRPAAFDYQEYALVGVIVLLLVGGAILEGDSFLTKDNMFNVLRQGSIVGVLAIGMTFVIATAGIDLSVGSMVAAAGVAGGLVVDNGSFAVHRRRGRCSASRWARVNGAAVAYGKVVPFIATLAMLLIARGSGAVDERQDADLAVRSGRSCAGSGLGRS